MLWLILLLFIAIAYEAIQALNRFGGLTTDDISNAEKQAREPRAHLTSPLLL